MRFEPERPCKVTVEFAGGLPRSAHTFIPQDPGALQTVYVRADLYAEAVKASTNAVDAPASLDRQGSVRR